MSSCTATLLDAALEYARLGWQVFPCHPTGHQPLDGRKDVQGHGGFHLATTDEAQIRQWWTRWPEAAIGLRTGEASGLFAVDVDPRNGGDISLENLEADHGPLPETVESQTGGGGRHLLFDWPGRPVPCSTGKVAPGIDVKADGGYIILPPSPHASGRTYNWLFGQEPTDRQVAAAPDWLLARIEEQPPGPSAPEASESTDNEIPEGYRNTTLASLAGHMRRVGMHVEAIKAALLETNARRCVPPLEEREVLRIATSIGRYDPHQGEQGVVEHWPERYLGDKAETPAPGPVLVCLADVEPRSVEWLWPRRIALGKITMLAGDPGLGKSFCSVDIGARISAGLAWPDLPDRPQRPGGVIILSAEDALDDTIRPRLDAAGADPSRICAIQAIQEVDPLTGRLRQRGFHLDKDLPNLEWALRQMPGCRLVIIDPISAYLGNAKSHNNAEIRGLLAPLSELATRHRVAVLCVSHLNKGDGDPMYRVMGSLAFIAAARAGYAVVKDRGDDTGQRRLVLPIKNNLGDDESGLAYRIVESPGREQPHIEWEPEPVYTSLGEALGISSSGGDSPESAEARQCRRAQTEEAVEWLNGFLADGLKPASEVIEAARKDGIPHRTLQRAKTEGCIVARREGYGKDGRWVWQKVGTDALIEQAKAANGG